MWSGVCLETIDLSPIALLPTARRWFAEAVVRLSGVTGTNFSMNIGHSRTEWGSKVIEEAYITGFIATKLVRIKAGLQ
jgi:hypothetical protein